MPMALPHVMRRRLSKIKQEAHCVRLMLSGNRVYHGMVDLQHVLIGEQCGTPLERWVDKTHEWNRASCLLKDSPYIEFLGAASRDQRLLQDEAFMESQPYFQMAQVAVAHSGSYFGATDSRGIKQQMRGFFETFVSLRDGRPNGTRLNDYRHSAAGEPLLMTEVRDSQCHELSDGHHRAAVYYMLGQRLVPARILGKKYTYLQRQIRRSRDVGHDTPTAEALVLDQPVEAADVAHWHRRRQCCDRLKRIVEFLRQTATGVKTALDAACGYGWFVDQLRRSGIRAVGATPHQSQLRVGQVAYGLRGDTIRVQRARAALKQNAEPYDMVLFLGGLHRHFLQQESESVEQMLQLLDKATGKILILESGHAGEAWFRESLAGFGEEQVRASILKNTSFRQVVSLGKDSDGQGPFEGQYGRTLFACLR